MLLHIHGFQRQSNPQPYTLWHSLTPQTRLLCTIIGVFAIALTPNGQWKTWGVYGLAVLFVILLSRTSIPQLLARVAIEFAFVGVVLLGTLFRREGEIVWSWGLIEITDVGLMVLGSVTIKVFLSLLMVNVLTLTTSISSLFQALLALKTPPLLVAIMASMYRYLKVLIDEFTTMRRAAMSRNLMSNKWATRRVIGNMIGALFIRTYQRGERIYQAMLARGYQGLPPIDKLPSYRKRDVFALGLTGVIVVLGQFVSFIIDH
ncbi:cobalt ABC transporter, inner membrane subunit CbiQ [Gloeothece citriformis PCC 7424]|uniref:Cobalt ABC transporter, inner membrane subunit CbiQ n=1 Tax=Gloeothece citriformis (strain PCC 7424) TaxID=65393 RepID=B7KGD7_GLOC7|nr:cobalt ECF transporter T component CbiQ [Gloeothece citriformis]ACK70608.1 cobalt ABC transporter, inner membrane subunit CbiQ [Gloeothece citriformis PCC 7424]